MFSRIQSAARRAEASQNNVDVIFDAKKVIRELNNIDRGLKKAMQAEMKSIANQSLVKDIRGEIQSIRPLSLTGSGRMSWYEGRYKKGGGVMKPDNVVPQFRTGRAKGYRTVNSLFSVWVRSPIVAVTGTAGKGTGVSRYGATREYPYKGGMRRHRNNGQGQALIRNVRSQGKFNWFYKTAEKSMPDVEKRIKLVWEKYSSMVSRRL